MSRLDLFAGLGSLALAMLCGVALALVDDPQAVGMFMGAGGALLTFATGALARHKGALGAGGQD